MTVGEVLRVIDPSTPVLLVVLAAFLAVSWFVLRRLVRAISGTRLDGLASEARLTGSIGRIGSRTGRLEARLQLVEFRRLQVEACLRSQGFALPPWPGDEDVYDDDPRDLDDRDLDDRDLDATRARPAIPPLPDMHRHRR